MSRKHAALQRKVIRLAGDWKDPHDQESWASRDIVQNIDVKEDGEVTITVKPNRPNRSRIRNRNKNINCGNRLLYGKSTRIGTTVSFL